MSVRDRAPHHRTRPAPGFAPVTTTQAGRARAVAARCANRLRPVLAGASDLVTRSVTRILHARPRSLEPGEPADRPPVDAVSRDHATAAATHDLLNAVTGLTGYLQLIESEPATTRSRELQTRARTVAQRLTLLGQDLLVHTTRDSGVSVNPETLSVAAELSDCLSGFPGLEISLDVDEDLLLVADRLRLHQVLSNLVTNSRRYGRPPVRITARRAGPGPDHDLVRITFTDAGDGVPNDFVPHLFEPHTRAPGTGRNGTGLGLALARELTERQGGTLTYHPGDAHHFLLTLPSSPRSGRDADEPPASATKGP